MRYVATISPDGEHLVYVGQRGATTQLYHRPLDQVNGVPIAGTDGAQNPFFSPDEQWVGFKVGNAVRKAPLGDGTPVTVCEPCQFQPRRI